MKRALVLALVLAACGNDHRPEDDTTDNPDVPFTECAADAASFVRQTFLALDGRRPKSQGEVDVYVDLYTQTEAAGGDPKDAVARAIMNQPELADRWIESFMDAIHVQRLDVQTEAACWDKTLRTTVDSGLAMGVRTTAANSAGDGKGAWTMLDLAKSAIALDDITPVYRAQLFSMVAHPIPAANVPAIEAELARRADFGETFDSAYLHRDMVCLGCHNSEHSVTDSDDTDADRHWPVPGMSELAVYGMSVGIAPDRAHTAFRVANFVDKGTSKAWGWSSECGTFASAVPDDPAGIDGKLASVTGKQTTVYTLEAALGRGFEKLRGKAPPIESNGAISDPDTALAWLVTLKITEDVWKKTTGTGLTIANYFPRNRAASDELYRLASTYTQSGFSLKSLLVAIVQSDYFNRKPAEVGCGKGPYTYPAVFDPWVLADADPTRRLNGPGDLVTAIDPRTLISATNAALDWAAPPAASRFPDYGDGCETETCTQMGNYCSSQHACCNAYKAACMMNGLLPSVEVPFERGIGMFLRNSERGFTGLDFQARLVWEDRYGACTKPAWVQTDFIDKIVTAATADPTMTLADLVSAIKDRIIGESQLLDGKENAALAAIFGGNLDQPVTAAAAAPARELCGALLGSPQFLLQGIAGRGGAPRLTPADASYATICAAVAPTVGGTCTSGKLTLSAQ